MDECKPLANGLRYVVLPNNVPGDRFEAHLEMHVGRESWIVLATSSNAY